MKRPKSIEPDLAASTGLGTHSLARQVHAGAGATRRLGFVSLLDLRGHGHEGLLDVGGALGGGLDERNAQGVSELLCVERKKEVAKRRNRSR
jgi:hypothetical protein